MNAEFERILYKTVEGGESLSAESMSGIYKDLTNAYYGDAVTLTNFDADVWAEWPHFYFDFYIYSYATSFAAAIQITENIRKDGESARDRFIHFLEAGGSDYPVDVLKKAGVDLTSPAPIEALALRLNDLMDEVETMTVTN
jgi:oligoendopeptidase F